MEEKLYLHINENIGISFQASIQCIFSFSCNFVSSVSGISIFLVQFQNQLVSVSHVS